MDGVDDCPTSERASLLVVDDAGMDMDAEVVGRSAIAARPPDVAAEAACVRLLWVRNHADSTSRKMGNSMVSSTLAGINAVSSGPGSQPVPDVEVADVPAGG